MTHRYHDALDFAVVARQRAEAMRARNPELRRSCIRMARNTLLLIRHHRHIRIRLGVRQLP